MSEPVDLNGSWVKASTGTFLAKDVGGEIVGITRQGFTHRFTEHEKKSLQLTEQPEDAGKVDPPYKIGARIATTGDWMKTKEVHIVSGGDLVTVEDPSTGRKGTMRTMLTTEERETAHGVAFNDMEGEVSADWPEATRRVTGIRTNPAGVKPCG